MWHDEADVVVLQSRHCYGTSAVREGSGQGSRGMVEHRLWSAWRLQMSFCFPAVCNLMGFPIEQ